MGGTVTALGKYLAAKRITYTDFARAVGAHKSQIARCASGERGPGVALALAIQEATKGAVPASGWPNRRRLRNGRRIVRPASAARQRTVS